jgi:hypothetical protein
MLFGVLHAWFKSTRVTVNSTSVRLQSSLLIFSRTREFSAGDYQRFATKMGMQSGTKVFTDIKLVKRGADVDYAQDVKKLQEAEQSPNEQKVNQLAAARFRQAMGPRGVTVASSIASAGEAEWLVREMNRALGRSMSRSEFSPVNSIKGPEIISDATKSKNVLVTFVTIALFAGGVGYQFWQQKNFVAAKPASASVPTPAVAHPAATKSVPLQLVFDTAFSSCSSTSDFDTNGFLVGAKGHADWFVSKTSGGLRTIKLKIGPVGSSGERLLLTLRQDHGGFPERTVEAFLVHNPATTDSAGWLVLDSRHQPMLEAGKKYWLCAKSSGSWLWHYGQPAIFQTTMYSPRRAVWTVGESTNVCAFSVVTGKNVSSSLENGSAVK